MKWTLVERGRTEKKADELVQKIDRMLGIIYGSYWHWSHHHERMDYRLILVGGSGMVFGIAAGKIRQVRPPNNSSLKE